MPIHEYQCRKCETVVERIEGVRDRPMKKCPSCGGKVDQMISSSAFVLKGNGWYASDYGTKNHDNAKEPAAATCPAAAGAGAPACAGCPKLD
jgi:putative FmdB family regulatory protein